MGDLVVYQTANVQLRDAPPELGASIALTNARLEGGFIVGRRLEAPGDGVVAIPECRVLWAFLGSIVVSPPELDTYG